MVKSRWGRYCCWIRSSDMIIIIHAKRDDGGEIMGLDEISYLWDGGVLLLK